MEGIKIYKFRIRIWQDLEPAKELPLHIRIPYKTASSGLFNVLKTALNLKLKVYNPQKKDGKLVYEQICETRAEAELEKDNIEGFFFGDDDKFKAKDEVKRILGKRAVREAIQKMGKKIKKHFTDGNKLLDFFSKFCIFVSWDVIE